MRRLLGLLAAALMAAPATAETFPDGGVTADEVAAVLHERGYVAEMTADTEGNPKIRSATNGINFNIILYGCKDGGDTRCHSISFSAGFDLPDGMSLADINTWNREVRFGRAFLDDADDPWVEMDVDTERGYTTEALGINLDTWNLVVPRFTKHIGW